MRVAKMLKNYVGETNDPHYAHLFLEASDALMQRAHTLAHGDPVKPRVQAPINIVC
jgi:hypothetical protein